MTGQTLAPQDAPDSQNVLAALLGESRKGRDQLVEHANVLSLRRGAWKYIEPGKGAKVNKNTNTEMGNDPAGQLYDLEADPGETRNLAEAQPERAREMQETIRKLRQESRTRQ